MHTLHSGMTLITPDAPGHVFEVLAIQESDLRNTHLKETIYEFLIVNFLENRSSLWDASHSVQFLQDLKRSEGGNPRMVVRLFCYRYHTFCNPCLYAGFLKPVISFLSPVAYVV